MNIDLTFSITNIIVILVTAGGFIGQWYTLKARSEKNTDLAQNALTTAIDAKNDLASLKLELVKDYARTGVVKEVEEKLTSSINKLSDEINGLKMFLMERLPLTHKD